jgi:hypothetical protein
MLEDVNNIKKDIQEYVQVQFDIIRLQTAETLSRIFVKVASIVVISYLLFFIIMFFSFAAGYFISSLLQSDVSGFLCVAGFYLVILIIFIPFRKKIIERPIIQAIVKLFFPKLSDDEKE